MPDIALDYLNLQDALDRIDTEVTAGEVHGTLSGLLCADPGATTQQWQQHLWPQQATGDLLVAEAQAMLGELHQVTRETLNDPDCDFRLLLPDDDEAISLRAQALGDWCQGFLTGLAIGGVKDFNNLPADAREIATDLVEIARAGSSYELTEGEEDEQAFAELVEYVRVGVMLINEELQPTRGGPQGDATTH